MIDFTGRRMALIGGAGFVGHHLALRLAELGAEVAVIDSLAVNNYYHFKDHQDVLPSAALYLGILQNRLDLLADAKVPVIELDVRDYHALSDTFTRFRPDTVVHLAAVAHADKSNHDPLATFDHSLRTLENALDNARSKALDIQHFVYFSSSMVYGNFQSESVSEDAPCEPLGIYGALKVAGERIVIAYHQVFDVPYTIIRPSALYGPRCVSRRVGQVFIENALQGLGITIKGDGADRLDFTYIEDLIRGVVLTLSNERAKNQTFNLTFGQSRSLADMAEVLPQYFPEVRVEYLPKDRLTPRRGTLSVAKARELIGYDPQYPLERGLVEYIQWYQSVWERLHEPEAVGAV